MPSAHQVFITRKPRFHVAGDFALAPVCCFRSIIPWKERLLANGRSLLSYLKKTIEGITRGAFGFSVLRFWSLLRSVFRFLHPKSPVFRFWYPLRFSVFPFLTFGFRFLWTKKRLFSSCAQLAHCTKLFDFITKVSPSYEAETMEEAIALVEHCKNFFRDNVQIRAASSITGALNGP